MIDRETVWQLLGGDAMRPVLAGRSVGHRREGEAEIEDLRLVVQDGTEIPAWMIRPAGAADAVPAVLYCHAHGGRYDIGRDEVLAGRDALRSPGWGHALAEAGLASLCLEMPCFGSRADPGESALSKAMLWRGGTLFGRMLGELRLGLDALAADPGVDPARLGVLGMSMGGTHAWWLAALDERVAAAVHMCCFADLGRLIDAGAHDGHGAYMTVPGLLARTTTGRLAGLAAPRAQLVCAGLRDWSTPPDAFATGWEELLAAYVAAGAADRLERVVEPEGGHAETAQMRAAAIRFLRRHLLRQVA